MNKPRLIDANKVIKQLEKARNDAFELSEKALRFNDFPRARFCKEQYQTYDKAIEIVKGGAK